MPKTLARQDKQAESLLKTRPIQPFGVEVLDLDLSQPLDQSTVGALKTLWQRNLIMLIRGQKLSEEQQIAFTGNFGPLALLSEEDKRSTRNPEIVVIGNIGETGEKLGPDNYLPRYYEILTGLWHTDGSYKSVPSYASALHALEVPPAGGETSFCNMIAALEALPPDMRRRIEGKHMVHNIEFTRYFAEGIPPRTEAQKRAEPPVCHPLIRKHLDGRLSLYISANVAYYVGNMPLEDGKKLHRELVALATRPEFVYRHQWRVGDVVMWDNRFTMHRVDPYDQTHRRRMQRTELEGSEIPV